MQQNVNCEKDIISKRCISVGSLNVMNNYATEARRRGRSLLVVEGNHEKNEVSQDMENGFIWVLNTCIFLIPDYNFRLIA